MNGKTYPVDDKMLNYTLVQPVGVCALVSPWNVPFMTATWKVGAVPGLGQYRSAENVRTVAADRRSSGRAGAGNQDPRLAYSMWCRAMAPPPATRNWCAIMMCAPSPSPAAPPPARNIMKNAGLKKYSHGAGRKIAGADF